MIIVKKEPKISVKLPENIEKNAKNAYILNLEGYGHQKYESEVEDITPDLKFYITVSINAENMPCGEYEYSLNDGEFVHSSGLIRLIEDKNVTKYNAKPNYTIYNGK